MAKPLVLISDVLLAPMAGVLSPHYRVETLWTWERAAFVEGPGRVVEAIVHAGLTQIDAALIAALPRLGLIACVSTGYDGVDMAAARSKGVAVTHAPGVNAADVADYAMGQIIAAWRGILTGDDYVRSGGWERGETMRRPASLSGRTLGIVGLGRIGEGIARRAEPFGLKVIWWGPRPKDAPWPRAESLHALASASDILVIACRADDANRHMIDRAVCEAVGPQGLLVNVSRGQIVQEDDLIGCLKSGALGQAALDVFWEEPTPAARWADVPNVIVTPHLAGSPPESVMKLVAQAMENLRRHFAGEPLASLAPA